MIPDFSGVTERPGDAATAEQLSMIHTRYSLASVHILGKDVVELACGPGRGLAYLADHGARSVTGLDVQPEFVAAAAARLGGRARVVAGDAQALPFAAEAFDAALLFEALYYLPEPARFAAEAFRVLRPGGVLLVSQVNPEWPEFIPSPHSRRYYSAVELKSLLEAVGFAVDVLAGFPAAPRGRAGRLVARLRRTAARLHLVPGTMRGKALLKRLFYGKLAVLGETVDESAAVGMLRVPGDPPVRRWKMLYAVARKP